MIFVNSKKSEGSVKDLAIKFGGSAIKLEGKDGSYGGFVNYLIRGKADKDEDVDESMVIYSPETGITCIHIPEEKKNRYRLMDRFTKIMSADEKFIAVLFEPDVPDLNEFSEKVLLLSDREKMRLGSILIDEAKENFISYEPFLAVWHISQVVSDGKDKCLRAPHLHFVMKQVAKRRTDKEIKLLEG